jgi:hypothetical protein
VKSAFDGHIHRERNGECKPERLNDGIGSQFARRWQPHGVGGEGRDDQALNVGCETA